MMPLPFCLLILVVGVVVLLWTRRTRLGKGLVASGTLLLLLFSNNLVSTLLVRPLEMRYAAIPEIPAGTPVPKDLAACRYVVVLGSGNGNTPGRAAVHQLPVSALARITEAVRLLRLLPDAKLLVSGPSTKDGVPSHAVVLARTAESLGLDRSRIQYIEEVKDTEDESNAVKGIVGDQPFALITSAWHMPRTMALFRYVGLSPLPCPTDYSARGDGEFNLGDLTCDSGSLERSTWAVRERIGYLWISLRGRG